MEGHGTIWTLEERIKADCRVRCIGILGSKYWWAIKGKKNIDKLDTKGQI